jgi:hypothetical protein
VLEALAKEPDRYISPFTKTKIQKNFVEEMSKKRMFERI